MIELIAPKLKASYAKSTEGASAIIAVPFNTNRNGKPDASDRQIAEIMASLSKQLGLPLYVQREHAEALRSFGIEAHEVYPTKQNEWVRTHTLISWMAERIGSQKKVIIVGHPHHVRRVAALAQQFGLIPLVAPESETVPYDPNGVFRHASSPWRYIPWEYASRLVLVSMWLLGKLK